MMDRTGIADNDGVRRHVTIDKGSRGDQNIVSNGDFPDHGSIDTNTHTTADGRDTLARPTALRSDGYAFVEMAIITKDGTSIHGDVVGVPHIEALSNPSATRDLNPVLSGMKPEQGLVNRSGESVFPSLGLTEKEMPQSQIPQYVATIPFEVAVIQILEGIVHGNSIS